MHDLLTSPPPRPAIAEPNLGADFATSPAAAPSSGPAVTRVLHAINGEHYAGAERVQDLLAAGLSGCGFEVGFACLKPGLFPAQRQTRSAALHELPMRGRFDLHAAWRMSRLVRSEGYQLIHAHTPRSLLIGSLAAKLARVPLVYHVHSPAACDTTHHSRNLVNHWCERFSLRGVAAVIAVSQSLGRRMRWAGYHDRQIRVVPNGVPVPSLRRAPDPPLVGWTLGTVALFRPRKGLEVLLEALAILRRQQLAIRLLAVGPFETTEYEREVRERIARLDLQEAVRWTGFTSDVATELARMDLLVLPSLFGEGLPMVLLEALAAGVPVVASRVEGVPDAIDDGVTGVLAQPGDSVDLARAISRVIHGQLDWSRLRANGFRRHLAEFSDEQMAQGVARVYRQVLAARRQRAAR